MSINDLNNILFNNNLDPGSLCFIFVGVLIVVLIAVIAYDANSLHPMAGRIAGSIFFSSLVIVICLMIGVVHRANAFYDGLDQYIQHSEATKAYLVEYIPDKHELTINENGKDKIISEAQNDLNMPIKIRLDSDKTYVEYKEVSGLTNWRSALNGEYDIVIHTFAGSQLSKTQ